MNRLRKFLRDQPTSFVALGFLLIAILLTGLAFSLTIMVATIINEDLNLLPLCLSHSCFKWFFEQTETAFLTAKATFDIGVAIATIGGIFVALLSYFSSSANSALTNHIEHLKVFSEYLDSEIKKRSRLSAPLIDTLYLYGFIFRQSRNGKTSVSDDYENFIKGINLIIDESNQRCVVGTPGGFSYKDHQRKIRDHLAIVGITVNTAPRNDYLEMEDELFSLLNRISQSFCSSNTLPVIAKREYY